MATVRVQRRLAAILAADVVGYFHLIGIDQTGTRARLNAHLPDLIEPYIAHHPPRIVETLGDGLLVEFPSIVDATDCTIQIQAGNCATRAHRRVRDVY